MTNGRLFSHDQVRLEELAVYAVRCVFWLTFLLVDDALIERAASGAAPLGAHLVNAVYKKLKSVGVETTLLQG